jgi:hypothetical protein
MLAAEALLGGKKSEVRADREDAQQELEALDGEIASRREEIEAFRRALEIVTIPGLREKLETFAIGLQGRMNGEIAPLQTEMDELPTENESAVKVFQTLGKKRELQKRIEAIQEKMVQEFSAEEQRIKAAIEQENADAKVLIGAVEGEIADLKGARPAIETRQLELGRQEMLLDLQLRAVAQGTKEALERFQALLAQFKGLQEAAVLAGAGGAAAAPAAAAAAEGPGTRKAAPDTQELGTGGAATVPAGALISAGKSVTVATSSNNMAEITAKRCPVNCIPSPESPAKRIAKLSYSLASLVFVDLLPVKGS